MIRSQADRRNFILVCNIKVCLNCFCKIINLQQFFKEHLFFLFTAICTFVVVLHLTMKKIFVTILSAIALFAAQATAQTSSDFGTWSSIQIVKSFGAPYAMARLEHRSYDNVGSTECWFAMAGGGYNFNSWLKADLSYEYWQIPAAGDMVQHKAVLCFTETLKRSDLALALREKYELAYIPDSDSFTNTLRTRLRGQYKIPDSIFTPYLMYEFFNSFDTGKWVRSLHYAGTEISLGGGHALDLFYMYHMYDKGGLTAACHLLGAGYVFVF